MKLLLLKVIRCRKITVDASFFFLLSFNISYRKLNCKFPYIQSLFIFLYITKVKHTPKT